MVRCQILNKSAGMESEVIQQKRGGLLIQVQLWEQKAGTDYVHETERYSKNWNK